MVCVALALLGSVAVTVIVALPAATGVMLTLEPDTLAVAFPLSEEEQRIGQGIAIGVAEVTTYVYSRSGTAHCYRL